MKIDVPHCKIEPRLPQTTIASPVNTIYAHINCTNTMNPVQTLLAFA
jgi:hypothetical protein